MSVINNTPFGGAFGAAPGFPEFESGAAAVPAAQAMPPPGDDVAPTPWGWPSGSPGAGPASPQTGWSFGSVMNDFMNAVSSLLGQLGSALGSTNGSSSPVSTTPATPAAPATPVSTAPPGYAETYYTSATASSVGDPHDSFDGTNANGTQTQNSWNNMNSHGDLLNSDSFAGGYRISTSATQPASNGTTLNQSATIATSGGATSVTLNGNGSYSVISNGQSVSLQTGVATSLGNGESVTLNADGSLTVNDVNAQGGSITTTLQRNPSGGVDVRASASDVDLGGYLTRGPGGPTPGPAPVPAAGVSPGGAPVAYAGPGVPPWPTFLTSAANPDSFGLQPF
jgi:hypothetical protein